jgi:putative hemolysin
MGSLFALFIALAICSAFFSGSETALFSLSRVELHGFREKPGAAASRILDLLRHPRHTIVTILLGNELVNVSMSIVGAAIVSSFARIDVRAQTLLAILIITPVVMIFCEIVPKTIALRHASSLAPVIVYPLSIFYDAISPLRVALTWIARRMVVLFGGSTEVEAPMVMEEEFRRLVDLGRKKGVIDEEESEIIHNVFEFTDKTAGEIMTPAERLFALPTDMPHDRLMEEIRSTQFSRVPFYEGDRSRFAGVLHVRDLFSFQMRREAGSADDMRILLRPLIFVGEATPLEELLREFQRAHMHMALVADDSGAVKGIVTMDDVLEELFGEMEE